MNASAEKKLGCWCFFIGREATNRKRQVKDGKTENIVQRTHSKKRKGENEYEN